MPSRHLNEVFELLTKVLPVIHKKIHRDVFKATIEKTGEDLAPHHLMILKMLRDGGLLNMSEIGEEIAISQSQMTHSADKLISRGMIQRMTDDLDRRRVRIRLTAKGRQYLERLDPIMQSQLESRLALLSAKDMQKLAVSLNGVAGIFNKLHWA